MNIIRELRKQRGLKLQDIADLLGITAMQVSRIERKQDGIKVCYAKKLGDFFNVDWKTFYE